MNVQKKITAEVATDSKEFQEEVKKIWKLIQLANPEQRKKIIDQLDEKTINALRTQVNPYKKPVIQGNKVRYLAFNFINLTAKYSQRFNMTALIGFLYRMLDEYKPPAAEKYVSENDPKFANIYNKKVRDIVCDVPRQMLMTRFNELKTEIEKATGDKKELKNKIKESFVVRAKLIKYQLYLYNEATEDLEKNTRYAQKDYLNIQNEISKNKIDLEAAEKMLLQHKIGAETEIPEESEVSLKKSVNIRSERKPTDFSDVQNVLATIKNLKLTDEKLQERLPALQEEFEKHEKKLDDHNNAIAALKLKFKQLKTEYDEKVQTKKEKSEVHILDTVQVDKYEPKPEDLNLIAEEVKKELGITQTAEEYTEEYQNSVQQFLDEYLRYNPDNHVRSAYKPNYEDPTRKPLKKETLYERNIIPPDDTFFRLNRYIENNYEPLRQATDDIYAEKSDFEISLVPLEMFEADSKEEADEKFNAYKLKYAEEFESDVFCARFNNHNLLGPWQQNNDVRDFYTKNTEIIKRILQQNQEDAKMGQKLMKDRARKKKTENGDTSKFEEYQKANPTELQRHGAKPMNEISAEEMIEARAVPKDTEELGSDEVEIGVHLIKPQVGRGASRRVRGFAEKWKFHVPSEELPENGAKIQSPSEFQKKLLKQEEAEL
jgi:hypothetical protein